MAGFTDDVISSVTAALALVRRAVAHVRPPNYGLCHVAAVVAECDGNAGGRNGSGAQALQGLVPTTVSQTLRRGLEAAARRWRRRGQVRQVVLVFVRCRCFRPCPLGAQMDSREPRRVYAPVRGKGRVTPDVWNQSLAAVATAPSVLTALHGDRVRGVFFDPVLLRPTDARSTADALAKAPSLARKLATLQEWDVWSPLGVVPAPPTALRQPLSAHLGQILGQPRPEALPLYVTVHTVLGVVEALPHPPPDHHARGYVRPVAAHTTARPNPRYGVASSTATLWRGTYAAGDNGAGGADADLRSRLRVSWDTFSALAGAREVSYVSQAGGFARRR